MKDHALDAIALLKRSGTGAKENQKWCYLCLCTLFSYILTMQKFEYRISLSNKDLLERFQVESTNGLSEQEASARQKLYGSNSLKRVGTPSVLILFFRQFKDMMIAVLIVAAAVSFFLGDVADAIAIATILFINAVIGAFQESRAHKALASLSALSTSWIQVLRDSNWVQKDVVQLTIGDVVKIEAGQMIAADIRLLESATLECNEASLTGESAVVLKDENAKVQDDTPLGDHLHTLYRGVTVTRGRGVGVVFAIGDQTQMGKIATLARESKLPETPLTVKLNQFAKKLTLWLLLICGIVFALGISRGEPLIGVFLLAVSLAVAAIPESLPAVVSMTLAMGARQLSKKSALVKNLKAVETLGSVDVICTDKTGTLTQNKMRVEDVQIFNPSLKENFILASLLCEDVDYKQKELIGDPTEVALTAWALEQNFTFSEYTRTDEKPFDSESKRMSVIVTNQSQTLQLTKGAPESIAENLASNEEKDWLLEQTSLLALKGLRTIALAMKMNPSSLDESNLQLLGVMGLIDPLREEVALAIKQCHQAGIKVVMITGDHKQTALAIGNQLHLMEENSIALDGKDLKNFNWNQNLDELRIISRADPEDKILLIEHFLKNNHVVAMTGDGVNDAAALKRAHIGVAMGLKGTDAARESSDMVLLDDNFSTIVSAIAEGRRLYANILKFIRFIFMGNTAEILVVLIAPLLGLGSPLSPLQILWVNLMTDSLPGLALSQGPAEKNILKHKPRSLSSPLLTQRDYLFVLIMGLITAASCLAAYDWALLHRGEAASTITFSVLVFTQLGLSLVLSQEHSLFSFQTLKDQKWLFAVISLEVGVHLLLFMWQPFASILDAVTLTPNELLITCSFGLLAPAILEITKFFRRT